MNAVGQHLQHLQTIDLTLREHRKRLVTIETELGDNALVQAARKAVTQAEERLKPIQTDLRDLELQVQTTKQKRESSQQRMYSGTVTNPKELQDIEKNIASLKRRQSDLEDKMLTLMMDIDAVQSTLNTAQIALEDAMQDAAANNQALLTEKNTLETEVAQLETERVSVVDALDAGMVETYETLRPKMAQRPIAILTADNTCSICGVQQTNAHAQDIRRADQLLRCANCNRIILAN